MDEAAQQRIDAFVKKWQGSGGNERANYQGFFLDLCVALGVESPPPKGSLEDDPFCFDKDIKVYHPSGKVTAGYIDFYKADHFIIEAKQGSDQSGKGTAKRGTPSYLKAMEKAFVQAIAYTRNVPTKPPYLLTCDIGSHFELWMGFNGDYGGYAARQDIELAALKRPEVFDLFVDIFTDPQARNPEKIAAKVTREVAADLANLTKTLEGQHEAQDVAHFLMRCIFTMFAEDVRLLKEELFTTALQGRWRENPQSFKPEVEALWQAMNEGGSFGFHGQLLRFNGGLFADPVAFDLSADQIQILLDAAERDWQNVEPAIFGTLLERALDAKERSKLGAHYTPRSYVERLVKPVVMEPLQAQWVVVQGEAKQYLEASELQNTRIKKENQKKKAIETLEAFLSDLRQTRILDPACGTGNFLYVTLDLMKQLESEVLKRLEDITGQAQLRLDIDQVNPSQFLGIELNPRAAAIADLVIWIGYLQWHFRRFGDLPPVEPVLREYNNIENRDAVLAYDGKEEDIDPETGQVRTRWGGRKMQHPVTGEEVPDPSDQIPIYRYLNPRPAEWPEADYVVSNPPFIGNRIMREALGDGYTETLRRIYADVPYTVDYVMYWWHKSAALARSENIKRFCLITTNTIGQPRLRNLIDFHLKQKHPLRIFFAIPDHPWTDKGAAVRIAMTGGEFDNSKIQASARLGIITFEKEGLTPEDEASSIQFEWVEAGKIFSNLKPGTNVASSTPLKSNQSLACLGVKLHGMGFCVSENEAKNLEDTVIHPYLNGRDLLQVNRNVRVIDLFGMTEQEVAQKYPKVYQWVYERVKPERDQNNRATYREKWWIFAEPRSSFRPALTGLRRYIGTTQTSKHRVFLFVDGKVIPDQKIVAIAMSDAFALGVLSSRVHTHWALVTGGALEDRPVYTHSIGFDCFPFPDPTPEQKQKIRDLSERLDAHRTKVQADHPDITITGMYNLLERLRAGEPFTDKDRAYNDRALVSTLKQIHDELDLAVLDVYGWPHDITDEQILENLVALNAQRAEEERNGYVRWLRPEYQAPDEVQSTQQVLTGVAEPEETVVAPVEQQKFPTAFKDQLAAIRDLMRTQGGEWTVAQVKAQFKNASRKQKAIQDCLDTLEQLGVIVVHTEDGIPRWYIADLQKAA
ncbi:MAG: class I SAM-dependent DNA methyltransferase [Leptolyngbyaceae cyanobacterium]